VNKNPTDATVCRYLFTAKLLYMFRVSKHPSPGVLKTVPAASGTGHTTWIATPLQIGLIISDEVTILVPLLPSNVVWSDQIILLVPLLPSNVVWSDQIRSYYLYRYSPPTWSDQIRSSHNTCTATPLQLGLIRSDQVIILVPLLPSNLVWSV